MNKKNKRRLTPLGLYRETGTARCAKAMALYFFIFIFLSNQKNSRCVWMSENGDLRLKREQVTNRRGYCWLSAGRAFFPSTVSPKHLEMHPSKPQVELVLCLHHAHKASLHQEGHGGWAAGGGPTPHPAAALCSSQEASQPPEVIFIGLCFNGSHFWEECCSFSSYS